MGMLPGIRTVDGEYTYVFCYDLLILTRLEYFENYIRKKYFLADDIELKRLTLWMFVVRRAKRS